VNSLGQPEGQSSMFYWKLSQKSIQSWKQDLKSMCCAWLGIRLRARRASSPK